jgi:hypothetical protein
MMENVNTTVDTHTETDKEYWNRKYLETNADAGKLADEAHSLLYQKLKWFPRTSFRKPCPKKAKVALWTLCTCTSGKAACEKAHDPDDPFVSAYGLMNIRDLLLLLLDDLNAELKKKEARLAVRCSHG